MKSELNTIPPGIASFEQRQAERAAANENMGRQEFLKLLTTQLQNQNPLDPMENEAFVAQLAQFSQLEATLRMADSMDAMMGEDRMNRLLEGASLIDRQVSVSGGNIVLGEQGQARATVLLPQGADALSIRVRSPSGEIIRAQELGPQSPGNLDLGWDGLNNRGERARPGAYVIEATVSSRGETSPASIRTFATVTGVRTDNTGQLLLELPNGRSVRLDQVERISN